jgi:hypothetical protein
LKQARGDLASGISVCWRGWVLTASYARIV